MSDCLLDVTWNISTLKEAYTKDGVIFAQDKKENSGAKRFAVAKCVAACPSQAKAFKDLDPDTNHIHSKESLIKFLSKTDCNWYEVLRVERPIRLFMDIEWNPADLNNKYPGEIIQKVCKLLGEYVEDSPIFQRKCILVCDRPNTMKYSYHIIYPDALFDRIDGDLKMFVLGFNRWIVEVKGEKKDLTFTKQLKNGRLQCRTVIDTAVYTKNRCFRALYQSKLSDSTRTTLKWYSDVKGFTSSDTWVQPYFIKEVDKKTLKVIHNIIGKRAPTDGWYPIYIDNLSLRWKRSKKTDGDRIRLDFDAPQLPTTDTLILNNDQTIAEALDSERHL